LIVIEDEDSVTLPNSHLPLVYSRVRFAACVKVGAGRLILCCVERLFAENRAKVTVVSGGKLIDFPPRFECFPLNNE
jgi:hypothetical protein